MYLHAIIELLSNVVKHEKSTQVTNARQRGINNYIGELSQGQI